ncbi:MAG TPA: LEA type 2 family protein [Xanthomonadaceae bacterium]|nr:LEA type 2 family protein [Xanthomonadaceae bacterium]
MKATGAIGAIHHGLLLGLCALLLASCASGPPRRVSEPAASIQQLTVRADGSWSLDLRIENFSSMPMRFGAISLPLTVADQAAGTLQGDAGISIGPESADVVTLDHRPDAGAKIALADALAGGRGVSYRFEGTLQAAPEDGKSRSYEIKRNSALSPVPGLPGVLR